MTTVTFPAMGTWFEVVARTSELAERSQSFVASTEAWMSRFLPNSEVSQLNDDPGETVLVPNDLAECLAAAADVRDRTSGLVDAGCGAQVVAWGYDRSFDRGLSLAAAPPRLNCDSWAIAGHRVTRSPTTKFDLGGIGKGWTADRMIESGSAEVVSAGGDVRSARNDSVVDVLDPWGDIAASVALGVGGLATSSTVRRTWQVGSETVHHIIDPSTGRPAQTPVLSATALADSAVEAEAAAKTILILGVEGLAWASRQAWVRSALAVWEDGNVYATSGLEMAA